MDGRNAWIKKGFDDGVFLLVGSIEPSQGGSIVAHNISLEEIQQRVNDDPFASENVVTAEIIEISPKKQMSGLTFLQINLSHSKVNQIASLGRATIRLCLQR